MNYMVIYNNIINKRRTNRPEGYTEKHHIIPKSLGGGDVVENLIKLTAREHFICHYILAKMYPKESLEWYKMNHAFLMMNCGSRNQDRYFNSRLYEALKASHSLVMSVSQTGDDNSQFGTMWISNIALKKSKKVARNSPILVGWVSGRNLWKKIAVCNRCGKEFINYSGYRVYCCKSQQKHKTNVLDKCKGTVWINDTLLKNRRISKNEPIPDGWVVGRKKITPLAPLSVYEAVDSN